MKTRSIARYGWVPDLPDRRDRRFRLILPPHYLPPSVDLRPGCCPVYDQGTIGSCTANAIAAAMRFELKRQKSPDFEPSRLMIYYDERVMEGTVNEDSGAMIRDGIKTVVALGACSEEDWPYDELLFADQPPPLPYRHALTHRIQSYSRLNNRVLNELRSSLALGFPFVFGFSVYESFESEEVASSGIVPMPLETESQVGGHAVFCVGYDDSTSRFRVQNSWGPSWGDGGFFTIPYNYLTDPDLADDFWQIRLVESEQLGL